MVAVRAGAPGRPPRTAAGGSSATDDAHLRPWPQVEKVAGSAGRGVPGREPMVLMDRPTGADARQPRTRVPRPVPTPPAAPLVVVAGKAVAAYGLVAEHRGARAELDELRRERTRVGRALRAETQLRPWQVELLKLQGHLERRQMRMIVLFE